MSADQWLAAHLKRESQCLVVGTGALLVTSLVNFRTGAQLKYAIEEVGASQRSVAFRSLALFGLGAFTGCVRTFIFDSTTERLRAAVASEVFAAQLCLEPGLYPANHKGKGGEDGAVAVSTSSATLLDSDVALCAEIVLKLQNIVRYTASVVGGTFAMFRASWKLSAAVWPLLVFGALHGARAGARQSGKAAKKLAAAREEALGFAEERLQHVDLVRWFARADSEAEHFRHSYGNCVAVARKAAKGRGIAHMVFDFITKGVCLGLCHLGSKLVQRGELTAGELTSFFFHASFLSLGLYGLVGLAPEVTTARAAAKRLQGVVAAKAAVEEVTADSHLVPWAVLGSQQVAQQVPALNFDGVGFAYPGGPPVLSAFSLSIAAGTTCALVGPSGCGKSTVLSLLLRDFDNFGGRILVGEREVREIPREHLRGALGIVPQQPALLSGSVCSAIGFGAPKDKEATLEDIEKVAKKSGAHEFISAKPEGYQVQVGRSGSLLSGGERQRVAVARALLRNAKILVLDEPTSALDTQTAAILSKALLEPAPDRPTTLIVTHSLSLIRDCDSIAVLSEEGRVVQQGNFKTLIADTGGALACMMKSGGLEADDVSA